MNALYCETAGAGSPLVLLHGWGTHGGIWEPTRESLASNHSLYIPDLPGHGRSRDVGVPSLDALTVSLEAIAPKRAVWIGWSLGGLAALRLALRAPQQVKALVLIAVTPCFVQMRDWLSAMPASTLEEFARGLHQDFRATLSRFLALQLGHGEAERVMLRNLRASLFEHGDPSPEGLAGGLKILRDTDLRVDLPAIDLPVLVVHGARDCIAPVAAAEAMAARLPQAELVLVPDAGHAPQLSHWPAVAPVLARFLSTHG
jgi:pimeloyl-[acyl-carrier protein] methyl ester esterase